MLQTIIGKKMIAILTLYRVDLLTIRLALIGLLIRPI